MADSNIYLATTNNEHYLINPIDWTDKTGNGVKDNSIPGSKIKDASIPSSKIVGDVASEDTYAREQLLLKQNINDTSLKTTDKTIVGAINEIYDNGGGGEVIDTVARNRTRNIDTVRDSYTSFNGTLASNTLSIPNLNFVSKITSDGIIPINITAETLTSNITQIDGDINVNSSVSLGNKYYEPLLQDNGFRGNINGALGWYVWKHDYVDTDGNEISSDSNITITDVKLKYATGRVLIGNNMSVKLSDWLHIFKNAFGNKSVVINAVKTTANDTNSYTVKYYQLSNPLKVAKINDTYQTTYNGDIYTITQVANYNFKATSVTDSNTELNCIAQTTDIENLINDTYFAAIELNTDSTDGTYTVNFSLPTADDNFSTGSTNITSNNGKQINDANFIPTLNWNASPAVVTAINKCKLYLSNTQATKAQFVANELPEQNLGNLFTKLDSSTTIGAFSYTQDAHYTNNLVHVSHDYTDGYNIIVLEYQKLQYDGFSNTNIIDVFERDYGKGENLRTWDTSLRVTDDPTLGCVQIFNFTYAEGYNLISAGGASHAEGKGCSTYEDFSHVEGSNNTNYGYGAHVEGWKNINHGYASHVEGKENICNTNYSHVAGDHNIASSVLQYICGKYNREDSDSKYAFIVGNGTSNTNRSNAFAVDWDGNLEASGKGSFFTSTIITNPVTSSQLFIYNNKIQINNSEEEEGFKILQANSKPFEFQTTGNSFTFKPNYSQDSSRYLSISSNSSNAYGVNLDSYSIGLSSEAYVKLSTGSNNALSLDTQSLKISTEGNDNIIINESGTPIPGTINIQFQVDTTNGNKVTPIFTFTGV